MIFSGVGSVSLNQIFQTEEAVRNSPFPIVSLKMAEKEENSRLVISWLFAQSRFGTGVEMEAAIGRQVSSRSSSKPGIDHSLLCYQIYAHTNQPYVEREWILSFYLCKARTLQYNVMPCYKISFINGFYITNSKSNRAWQQSQNSAAAIFIESFCYASDDEKETMLLMCRSIFLTHDYIIGLDMEQAVGIRGLSVLVGDLRWFE